MQSAKGGETPRPSIHLVVRRVSSGRPAGSIVRYLTSRSNSACYVATALACTCSLTPENAKNCRQSL
jgi:hypothetical protein